MHILFYMRNDQKRKKNARKKINLVDCIVVVDDDERLKISVDVFPLSLELFLFLKRQQLKVLQAVLYAKPNRFSIFLYSLREGKIETFKELYSLLIGLYIHIQRVRNLFPLL